MLTRFISVSLRAATFDSSSRRAAYTRGGATTRPRPVAMSGEKIYANLTMPCPTRGRDVFVFTTVGRRYQPSRASHAPSIRARRRAQRPRQGRAGQAENRLTRLE